MNSHPEKLPRQAILLTAHRNPEQVRRLVRRLSHPRVDIYLHVDRRIDPRPFAIEGTRMHPDPAVVPWGSWGLVDATQRLLEFARSSGTYSHFTHLSGQDYPLVPIDRIVDSIAALDGDLLDMGWSHEDRSWRWAQYHITTLDPMARIFQRLHRKLTARGCSRVLPEGLSFACGSALWTLSSESVDWIFQFLRVRPDVAKFFRNTLHTSEMFYQILVQASPLRDKIRGYKHYVDWSAGHGLPHPKVLGMEDFDRMRESGMWFARKFDASSDSDVLDRIDRELIGTGD